ncbi:hypothetical protein [Streptomyces sp. NBC_00083]|uniref:hypothetical protein n=1 Tax=Streptomyces sp. NBC_00083 TaxID=2975647 RepID=UPI00224D6323|nr:hypothetical protein [Streptomyces sp. NBC_00083]MCX5384740.1 hypothetical protein [Streptomyces sp. NBC_00083]
MADQSGRDGREMVLALALAAISEALALLTLGLVRPWGETAPRRLPFIGGRRVPPLAAVVPALFGAAVLGTFSCWFAWTQVPELIERVTRTPAQHALLLACYAPLLAATALSYLRRRTADPERSAPGGAAG